jgi:hypothetical protein
MRRRRPERVRTMLFPRLPLKRARVAGIAALIACAAASGGAGAAPQATSTLICTNPAGHVSWRIHIDFARSTVDSNPARISEAQISWHDRTDGGNYTLDRKSGELTVVLASSTGGYFLHDRCALNPLKPKS